MPRIPLILLAALAFPGCVSTVYDVATAPVRVGAKVVDWTTTSRSEADRNYGRKMRKQEAREGREEKRAAKEERREQEKQQREARSQAQPQGAAPY